jgi:hypothetical protein
MSAVSIVVLGYKILQGAIEGLDIKLYKDDPPPLYTVVPADFMNTNEHEPNRANFTRWCLAAKSLKQI